MGCDEVLRIAFSFPFLGKNLHDFGGWPLGAIQVGHDLHCGVDVPEEFLVGGAEVVESPLAVGCPGEAVLWALPIAGESHFAVAAVLWQPVALGVAEVSGHGAVGQFTEGGVHQVAQLVVGIDVVVAGVNVSVMLHGEGASTGF